MGYAHLKSGGAAVDLTERLDASAKTSRTSSIICSMAAAEARRIRAVDPHLPRQPSVLDAYTPVIWAGDFNEDENTNGRDGPVLWMTRAELCGRNRRNGS
jgi:hypothetical protein